MLSFVLWVLGTLVAGFGVKWAKDSALSSERAAKASEEGLRIAAETLKVAQEESRKSDFDRIERDLEARLNANADIIMDYKDIQRAVDCGLRDAERIREVVRRVAIQRSATDPHRSQLLQAMSHARDYIDGRVTY